MSAAETAQDAEPPAAEWDLSALVDGRGDAGAEGLLEDAGARTARFVSAHAGTLAGLSATGLVSVMRELAVIRELMHRAEVYAQLRFATDSADVERRALLDRVRTRTTELATKLVFFDLEWTALDPDRAAALLDEGGEDLAFAAYHLRTLHRRRPHTLSLAEERLMTERRLTGELAWARLFEELAGGVRVSLDGQEVPFSVAYNQLEDGEVTKRRAAADAMAAGLLEGLQTRAYVLNTLLQDKAVEDRLRGHPSWLASRNLDNQLDDRSVQALIDAVRSSYGIAQRWCRVKARMLGRERLAESDLVAPVLADETHYPYGVARDLVLAAYRDFSPEVATLGARFFDEGWIDAPIRPHKMIGAFCETPVGAEQHPYLLLNHGGRRGDVFTIAHELGHGIHDLLSARQGVFHQLPATPVAETASTFGELLLLERMLGQASGDRERLSLLAAAINNSVLTIFHQVAYNRFEHGLHSARRTEGELSVDRVSELYREAWGELYGDCVDPHPGMEHSWSMVPHFFLWPGYVYSYAYGQLLSLAIFARYRELGSQFVPAVLEFLSAGGSRSPEDLARIVGARLDDPDFWDSGLRLVEQQVRAVEELLDSGASGTAP